MEADTSDIGVGAVLSQRATSDQKLHPVHSSPASCHQQRGTTTLEWQHWLEGAKLPFLVWTDHKNLEYISSAKRLNSRQARWALFFTRFNFTLSYHPGSKNVKLSWQFADEEEPTVGAEIILPPSCVVASLTWEVEERVQAATARSPGPSACPDKCVSGFHPQSNGQMDRKNQKNPGIPPHGPPF